LIPPFDNRHRAAKIRRIRLGAANVAVVINPHESRGHYRTRYQALSDTGGIKNLPFDDAAVVTGRT
jgi:hypothetical protein